MISEDATESLPLDIAILDPDGLPVGPSVGRHRRRERGADEAALKSGDEREEGIDRTLSSNEID